MTEILGIDGGNFQTKVANQHGVFFFNSAMLDNYEISSVTQRYGEDDMLWRYDGLEGVAGTIATYEGSYGDNRQYGETKNHFFGQLRILLAVHQFVQSESVEIVIGQPFSKHQQDKEEMINSLQRKHPPLTVNGVKKNIHIQRVSVSMEGAAAFYSTPIKESAIRLIDIGSGTVNCMSFRNGIMVKDQSTTLPFGTESKLNGEEANLSILINAIHRSMTKVWKNNDYVYVCGGVAEQSLPQMKRLYPNAKLLQPMLPTRGISHSVHPKFANAVGMYRIARNVYEKVY